MGSFSLDGVVFGDSYLGLAMLRLVSSLSSRLSFYRIMLCRVIFGSFRLSFSREPLLLIVSGGSGFLPWVIRGIVVIHSNFSYGRLSSRL